MLLVGLAVIGAIVISVAFLGLFLDWVNLGFFGLLIVIGLIVLWAGALYDMWRRADLNTGRRVLWTATIVLLPLFGSMLYLFTRPDASKITYVGE